jgi:L-threonylcarbamoyladenylate synthase
VVEVTEIAEAAEVIRRGGVVAYPTDTFYGLGVDPRNAGAVGRLFVVKGRDADKASPLIASSLAQAAETVVFTDMGRRLAERFWPGPLSLLLMARDPVSREALGGGDTAAIRVPDDEIARDLAAAVGYCITATSANVSGRPPASTPALLDDEVRARVDFIIQGTSPGGAPSTIVDVTGRVPRLVRAGAIAWDRVLESLQ